MTTHTPTQRWSVVTADPATCSAVLAIYLVFRLIYPALTNTSTQGVVLEAIAVLAMVVVTVRVAPPTAWTAPTIPDKPLLRRVSRDPRVTIVVAVGATIIVATATQIVVTVLAAQVWPIGDTPTFNDPELTGLNAAAGMVDAINAGIGEELVFRFALLPVAARYLPLPIAVAAQAVAFGLAHTGFDDGYSAATVLGIIALGVVLAVATIITGSIWPAAATHTIGNVVVVVLDYDLLAAAAITALMLTAAAVLAAAVNRTRTSDSTDGES